MERLYRVEYYSPRVRDAIEAWPVDLLARCDELLDLLEDHGPQLGAPHSNAMADIPYQPLIRDRDAERARLDRVPGYSEARREAAVEFHLLSQLLEARKRAGLTQEEVALRMGTTRSAISRLEGSRKHLPALSTLRRYADVLGCDVEIQLVPRSPEGVTPREKPSASPPISR